VEVEVRLPWAATSILFGRAAVLGEPPEPLLFSGLYLDRVLAAIAAGREQCELAPFFRTPLRDDAVVWCRHQVLKNLEGQAPGTAVRQFAEQMRDVRDDLARAGKLRYRSQKGAWFLSPDWGYCTAVGELAAALTQANAQGEHDGSGTYRLSEGAPIPTSYGEDWYRETFAACFEGVPGLTGQGG
jgi:hypothetical protein